MIATFLGVVDDSSVARPRHGGLQWITKSAKTDERKANKIELVDSKARDNGRRRAQ